MKLNNQDILSRSNNIGKIVSDGLKNPIVRQLCTHPQNKSYSEIKKIQMEFSRFIGFCILFKSIKNVDDYMLLYDRENQINFLKEQIAKQIGIPKQKIIKRRREIVQFAVDNFKKDGYVFHAANSLSVVKKMTNGLIDNDVDIEQQKELLKIESLYRKYNPNSDYSPIGHSATDIISGTVNPIKNCCCNKKISPNKLSFVDLSPILPRSKKDDINISQNNNSIMMDDNDER